MMRNMDLAMILLVIVLLWIPCNSKSTNKFQLEKRTLDMILDTTKYDRNIRPPGKENNDTGPVVVKINIFLRSISKIDDANMEYDTQITFRQEWKDIRLSYDDKGGTLRYVTLTDPSRIWTPDVFFSNEKRAHFHELVKPNVLIRIFPNGEVLYSVRISLTLSCPMDLTNYPLDAQTCSLALASYGYTTEDIVFVWQEGDPVQVPKSLHLPEFTLNRFSTDYIIRKTNTGDYSGLRLDFVFFREVSFYLVHIYIPYIFMVILSWIPFWLDYRATTARVAIWVTILLAMTIITSSIQSETPSVSYTRSIDVWTGMCLAFLFAVVIELAFVTQAMVREEKVRKEANEALAAEDALLKKPLMSIDDTVETNKNGGRRGKLGRVKQWLERYQSQAMKIDVVSRFGFPLAFLLFNIFYWSSYSGRS